MFVGPVVLHSHFSIAAHCITRYFAKKLIEAIAATLRTAAASASTLLPPLALTAPPTHPT
jgi:hypothetical protein